MKKQFAILFLILIINIPFIGFYSVFNLQKIEIENRLQTEINNGNHKSELVSLTFTREQTQKDLKWLSKREFEFTGMVYNVMQVQYSGDKIIYICHRNIEVASLIKNFETIVDAALGHNKDTQTASENFSNFLQSLFAQNTELDYCSNSNVQNDILFYYNKSLIFHYYGSVDPPPKFNIC